MFGRLQYKDPLKFSCFVKKGKCTKSHKEVSVVSSSQWNASQLSAIDNIVRVNGCVMYSDSSPRVSVLNGPPGTGKSAVLIEIVKQLILLDGHRGKGMWVGSECNETVKELVFKTQA